MKKTRIVALALVVAIMLMGVGYAYWTDSLLVTHSVETGDFEVVFVDDAAYPKIFGATGETYVTKTISQTDPKTTSVVISNMYPGRDIRYEAKIMNTGSIPAVFDNAVVSFGVNNTEDFTDALYIQPFVKKYHANGTAYVVGEPGYWAGASLGYKPVSNLQANLNTIFAGCRLEPDEFVTFDIPDEYLAQYLQDNPDSDGTNCVEIRLPAAETGFENATATFDVTINWKQHNQP